MRDLRGRGFWVRLDDPVIPLAFGERGEDIRAVLIVGVVVVEMVQSRVLPVDFDAAVQRPDVDVGPAGDLNGLSYRHVQGLRGAAEAVAWSRLLPVRFWQGINAAWWRVGIGGAGRIGDLHALVVEDTEPDGFVCAATVFRGYCSEPIICSCLVGVDNYVVALAAAEQQLFGEKWLDGDEVRGYDLKDMVVERNSNEVADGSVDQP